MAATLRFLLPPLGALLVAALAIAPGRSADSGRITLRVEVFGSGGMQVATDRTIIDEAGGQYAIIGDLGTSGLAGLFQNFQSHSEVRGRLASAAERPEAFHADIRRNGTDRHDRVDYRADGTASGSSTPTASGAATGASAIPGRGTVDPLTAYFVVERQLGRGGSCTISVPVFDGRHRYNLQFTDAGQQSLTPSGNHRFSGVARLCHMRRDDVAGYPTEQLEMPKRGSFWYARLVPGDLMLPVRMELVTDIGTVNGYLAELHGRGVDLRFME
jgi:hypothetical protein